MIATYKIAKLIELGYGGMVTDEEWKNKDITKWIVVPNDDNGKLIIVDTWHNSKRGCIAFHTQQQAKEFMSYPENRTLVKQYYMI